MTDLRTNALNELIQSQQAKPAKLANELDCLLANETLGGVSLAITNDVILETIKEETAIDLHYIHCSKTGQPIAKLSDLEIDHMLAFYGVKSLNEIADKLELASAISRIWLQTNPENLDKLQAIDPRGFFCYCMNIILQGHHMRYINNKRQFPTIEAQTAFKNSLVKSWYQTELFTHSELEEVNKQLRVLIYLNLHKIPGTKLPWHNIRQQSDAKIKLAYNPDISPLFPHEFACASGLAWIAKYLPKLIQQAKAQLDYNNANFDRFVFNSAFRLSRGYSSLVEEFNMVIGDLGIVQKQKSISELVRKAKQINEQKQSGQIVKGTLSAGFTFKVAIKAETTAELQSLQTTQAKPFAPKTLGKLF